METSTGSVGAAARAMPSSRSPSGSLLAPYTESASPAVRVRKVRRLRPLPAGSGMPSSMTGRPRPASATERRRIEARENSLQEQLMSAGLVVGGDGDEHSQGVEDEDRVLGFLPVLVGIRERGRRKAEKRRASVLLQPRVPPEVEGSREEVLRVHWKLSARSARVECVLPGGVVGGDPAAPESGRVEPALLGPAGDVGRVEEPLAVDLGDPGPGARVNRAF